MAKPRTTKEALNLAKKFVQEVKQKEIKVQKAFLFGSYAKKKQKDWSDIDVCLVIKNHRSSIDDFFKFTKLIEEYPYSKFGKVEVHAFCLGDFNNRYLSLPAEIKKTGIEIKF